MAGITSSGGLARFRERLPKVVERAVDQLGARAEARLKELTPVDTGEARAGWQKETSGEGLERKVIVKNEVPHIRALEHGHSKQAPAGMVAVFLAEVEAGGG